VHFVDSTSITVIGRMYTVSEKKLPKNFRW